MGTVHVVRVTIEGNRELKVVPPKVEVLKSDDPIVIVWKFEGNARGLVFGDGAGAPGFKWANPQAPRGFSGPWYSADDKRVILDDSNFLGSPSDPEHVYELCAYDAATKTVYRTGLVKLEGQPQPLTTNPAIINK